MRNEMKKTHKVLIAVTIMLTIFSFYSIFAINQAYKINFEWYSQYHQKYSYDSRDFLKDNWYLSGYPNEMQFVIINGKDDYRKFLNIHPDMSACLSEEDLKESVYIYCSFGRVYSPDYRIKVKDIVQIGNVVEIKISINSPTTNSQNAAESGEKTEDLKKYIPEDIIKISKDNFFVKGEIWFIIKNQDGKVFYKMYHNIK
jgi:hypothetical protein